MSRTVLLISAVVVAATFAACKQPEAKKEDGPAATASAAVQAADGKPAEPEKVEIGKEQLVLFGALPKDFAKPEAPITEARVKLGRLLYDDKRLSKNQELSCNSCHDLEKFGVDNAVTSTGHKGQKGSRNSPTVYNAAGHFVQFWDGRAATVEEQATGPILNPVEMALPDEKAVVAVLESMPEYVAAFKAAFPEDKQPVSLANVGKAIGAFERTLVTPSRFDEFLGGKQDALTQEEKKGLSVFISTGCTACHSGALFGGAMYQRVGAVKPWPNQKDQGRFEATKSEGDKMMFKVPSLRNVAKTAPYFHDGSAATLEEAVRMMGEHQLGRKLSDADAKSIATFLGSLTGTLPADKIAKVELPKSTAKTPKPVAD